MSHLLASEPFFERAPPKSTGRDLFNAEWLDTRLEAFEARRRGSSSEACGVDGGGTEGGEAWGAVSPQDVQTTLVRLTAVPIVRSILPNVAHPSNQLNHATVIVCGGGARNAALMVALNDESTSLSFVTSESPQSPARVPVDSVEALAFAWLAKRHVERRAGNWPAVTGASGPRVLGALYPR